MQSTGLFGSRFGTKTTSNNRVVVRSPLLSVSRFRYLHISMFYKYLYSSLIHVVVHFFKWVHSVTTTLQMEHTRATECSLIFSPLLLLCDEIDLQPLKGFFAPHDMYTGTAVQHRLDGYRSPVTTQSPDVIQKLSVLPEETIGISAFSTPRCDHNNHKDKRCLLLLLCGSLVMGVFPARSVSSQLLYTLTRKD